MCVTTGRASIGSTMAFTYAVIDNRPENWHVSGYQNTARNLERLPNCMLLHFPGNDLQLVVGPEQTRTMMRDMIGRLPSLDDPGSYESDRGLRGSARMESYGDYDVVLSENPTDILAVLESVRHERRPRVNDRLIQLIDWYRSHFPDHSFVLACFDASVVPKHPIVVEYVPHNDDVMFIPGLEGHHGSPPEIGELVSRDFSVAFGIQGQSQPFSVTYGDRVDSQWAPSDVTGFRDNRRSAPNNDYCIPLDSVREGLCGDDLFELNIV